MLWLHLFLRSRTPSSLQTSDPVIPIISRVAERLVVSRWLRPAIPRENLSDQFAFKPTGSTTNALIYLMHHVTCMLENGASLSTLVRCLLIDFSKAFDVVNHVVLLRKLEALKVPSFVYNWIVSFLSCRQQICKVGNMISEVCSISRGIIQSSLAWDLLYTL